jgi:methanogenic corrinoid protein MtbC1
MVAISEYSEAPRYNIKAVEQKSGIQSVTIRAWERRYGLLTPTRAENGYRLYSERDIAVLQWARSRVESGISISSAVNEFLQLQKTHKWPEAIITGSAPVAAHPAERLSADAVSRQFLQALLRHDEKMASGIFEEMLGSFDLIELFEHVLTPVLVEIGEGWARGEVKVATEHFASNLVLTRLQAIFQSLPLRSSAPRVMIGCAPDELHVIGPLMLAVLLREIGYRVEFLGPDLPLDDLAAYVMEEPPKMLILSATLADSAASLVSFPRKLHKAKQIPLFGFGGSGLNTRQNLIKRIDGIYLGPTLRHSLETIRITLPLRSSTKK